MHKIKRFAVGLCLLTLGSTVNADVVVLQSGSIHEGKVHKFDNEELILEIESGKIVLHQRQIASIHFDITAKAYEAQRSKELPQKSTKSLPGDMIEFGRDFIYFTKMSASFIQF